MNTQVCSNCEEFNQPGAIACRSCNQDLRIKPIQDFINFTQSPPKDRKIELIFQFGVFKNIIKISFDALNYVVSRGRFEKIPELSLYYRMWVDRVRNSLCYYLFLYSNNLFCSYDSVLNMNCHIFFAIIETFSTGIHYAKKDPDNEALRKGMKIIENQRDKIYNLIDEMTRGIEAEDEDEIEERKWEYPPLPPVVMKPVKLRRY